MRTEMRKEFRRKYIGIEVFASIALTLVWLAYQLKHEFYGQSLTYWICACMIALMTVGLMIPALVKEKTRKYKKSARICLNSAARHIPMTIVWSFAWSVHLSSDFGTTLATVSMSQVLKYMIYGVLACPIIFDTLMVIVEAMAAEDIKADARACETA